MKLVHCFSASQQRHCLGILEDDGVIKPFTGEMPIRSIDDWLSTQDALETICAQIRDYADEIKVEKADIYAPIVNQEVWGAGVTYDRSKVARMEESETGGSFYDLVYTAERPELFFKASSDRVADPGAPIRIRKDSTWNVPEPELALVFSAEAQLVGYTIGNDVSSRSIEGENPLYLPQAKVYRGCCSIGPAILLANEKWTDRTIHLTVRRGSTVAFEGEVSTDKMRRTPEELADYLFRDQRFHYGVYLLTGTGIVPPDEFTLLSGDVVAISIDGIGTLTNPVA